jgi:hypothetical protein
MEHDLIYIFNTIAPVRTQLLFLLKPSEILNFCIALGCILSDKERYMYMYPLNEIFYSRRWIDNLFHNGGTISLIGDDVSQLCDSRHKQIKLWCFIWRDITKQGIPLTDDGLYWETDLHFSKWSKMISDDIHIYNDVEVRPTTISRYSKYTEFKRIVLYTCIIDNSRTFKLSISPISELTKDKITPDRLHNITKMGPINNQIKRTIFRDKLTQTNTIDIAISSVTWRRCYICYSTIYTIVNIKPSGCLYGDVFLSKLIWYYWPNNPSCLSHGMQRATVQSIIDGNNV